MLLRSAPKIKPVAIAQPVSGKKTKLSAITLAAFTNNINTLSTKRKLSLGFEVRVLDSFICEQTI